MYDYENLTVCACEYETEAWEDNETLIRSERIDNTLTEWESFLETHSAVQPEDWEYIEKKAKEIRSLLVSEHSYCPEDEWSIDIDLDDAEYLLGELINKYMWLS